jgi:hypothetical protein
MISQVVFYYMHSQTYVGSAIYDNLYGDVTPEYLLDFLLQNFIAAYAVSRKIEFKLPADLEKIAQELAEKMTTHPLIQP